MSKVGKYLLKTILIVMYPVFVGATIALGVVAYLKTNEINNAYNQYAAIRSELIQDEQDKQGIINGMTHLGDTLRTRTNTLNDLNKQLEDSLNEISGGIVKKNYGQIRGEILPFVTGGSSLSQYQRVCAELVKNTNEQFCVNVSALSKEFTLPLPVGEYYVFAQLVDDKLDTEIKNYKAYYTEFVQCKLEKKENNCATSLSAKKAKVFVENSKTAEEINPIDWDIENLGN